MKIPKILNKNNQQYKFVKQYPNFIQYRNAIYGYSECFNRFDLGLVEEQMKKSRNVRLISKF